MKKLFEKGKQFLKKLEEDHDKKRKDSKEVQAQTSSSTTATTNTKANGSSPPTTVSQQKVSTQTIPPNLYRTDEERKLALLEKSIDSEKQFKLCQLLLQEQKLSDEVLSKLQKSIYTREQHGDFHSIHESLRGSTQIDFSSQRFKNIIEASQTPHQSHQSNPLYLIGVVGFHHKQGSIVEFQHPSTIESLSENQQKQLMDILPNYCMPDAIHNKNEDYVYFTITLSNSDQQNGTSPSHSLLLFGVSYFKQIKVSEAMKQRDKELTRSHLQKSVFVLSSVPLQGYIMGRLEATTRVFFEQDDISDFSMLRSAFNNMNQSLSHNENIQESEIYIGTSLKTLVHFMKDKMLVVLKAVLLQKKVLVFSLHSCATSNFIVSLLSLIPGLSFFRFSSKHIDAIASGLKEYGLPLRIFNEFDCPLEMYFTIQQLEKIKKYNGYLIGTTNQLIKTHKSTAADVVIDLDANTVLINSEQLKTAVALNASEKKFAENITKTVGKVMAESDRDWKNMEYSQNESTFIGSNDWIRMQVHQYVISMLCELDLIRKRFSDLSEEIGKEVERRNVQTHKEEMGKIHAKLDRIEAKKVNQRLYETSGNSGGHSSDSQLDEIAGERSKDGTSSIEGATDEEIMNQLFDDVTGDDDEEGDASYAAAVSGSSSSTAKSSLNYKIPSLFLPEMVHKDGDSLIGFGNDDFDKPSNSIAERKTEVKQSYKTLKQFNLKFIRTFIGTDVYKYWHGHHDTGIWLRSKNAVETIENTSVSLDNGDIYIGSMQNGERAGKGTTFEQVSGRIEWCAAYISDEKNGEGSVSTVDTVYFFEGAFSDNLKEGFGNLVTDKEKYSGQFHKDKFHGQGTLVTAKDGSVYEGEFENGVKSGMGKFLTSSLSYVGQFVNNQFSGKGQLVRTDTGNVYCGDFKYNEMHGQGEYQTTTYTYTGEFSHGKFAGQGMYKDSSTLDVFQGEFKDGAIDFKLPCIIKYYNGDVFSGPILNWLPHGKGLISYKDGRLDCGEFLNGKLVSTDNSKDLEEEEKIKTNVKPSEEVV